MILLSLGVMGKQALTLHGFESVINHGEITAAKEVYDRKLNGRFMRGCADRIVVSYIDALLDSYAENKIDASYTGTKLRECSVFENEEEYLRKILEKASQMEISKNAYVSGTSYFEQGNYLQGLSDWMNVIPQDINNYNAVRAIVEKYGSEYKLHGLLQCAEYKSNGDTVRYQKGLDVLLQWFPNDRDMLNLLAADRFPEYIPILTTGITHSARIMFRLRQPGVHLRIRSTNLCRFRSVSFRFRCQTAIADETCGLSGVMFPAKRFRQLPLQLKHLTEPGSLRSAAEEIIRFTEQQPLVHLYMVMEWMGRLFGSRHGITRPLRMFG